jgi:hypothetical protein
VEPLEKTKGMATGHALIHSAISRSSAFSLELVLPQSLPAAPLEPLNSTNKVHPTAKPNNDRQTSKKYFQNSFHSQTLNHLTQNK